MVARMARCALVNRIVNVSAGARKRFIFPRILSLFSDGECVLFLLCCSFHSSRSIEKLQDRNGERCVNVSICVVFFFVFQFLQFPSLFLIFCSLNFSSAFFFSLSLSIYVSNSCVFSMWMEDKVIGFFLFFMVLESVCFTGYSQVVGYMCALVSVSIHINCHIQMCACFLLYFFFWYR